ncbi:MAG: T9SS type B sorting domain-containing protein [Flavobacteriaceae bacterium]
MKNAALILFGLMTLPLWSQGPTSTWYFGRGAGIRFNPNGTVTALTDGRLNTIEGCATISDASGHLLFYTDGITVYNSNHQVMENGHGLYGDPSSTQSAIIVPHPGNVDQYFVFTVDTTIHEDDPDRGLNYSLVDMSLNDGLGAVVQKNVNLLVDCSEKITAVLKNCTDRSIWVLTLASSDGSPGPFDTYHAFEVNSDGVSHTSVRSTFDPPAINDPRGYLKLSPEGDLLANANMKAGLFLFDFNASSGIVSNQRNIALPEVNSHAYGVEFSPDGHFLYVHASNDQPQQNGHTSSLLQLDLDAANIAESRVVLDERPIYRGALQMGENGKIYRTISENYLNGSSYLGVIHTPNATGQNAQYQHNAVSLGSKEGGQGLPPFVQSLFNTVQLVQNTDGTRSNSATRCQGEGIVLQTELLEGATYRWIKDGNTLEGYGTHFLDLPELAMEDAGYYRLEITIPNQECPIIGEARLEVLSLPEAGTQELVQCDIDENPTDGYARFDLTQLEEGPLAHTYYLSMEDMASDNHIATPQDFTNTVAERQTLYYKVVNDQGCENTGELHVRVHPVVLSSSGQHTYYACDTDLGDTLTEGMFDLSAIAEEHYPGYDAQFYGNVVDASLEQHPLPSNYLSGGDTIYLRLENANECQDVMTIDLRLNPSPDISFPQDHWLCIDGEPTHLRGPVGFDLYRWGQLAGNQETILSETPEVQLSESGNYFLEVGLLNNGLMCTVRTLFEVRPSEKALIQDLLVQDLSSNNSVEIIVTGEGDYEYSLDSITYRDSPLFNGLSPGIVTVYVRDRNGCGITEQKVAVLGYAKFFTPNGDSVHPHWQLIGADGISLGAQISIFDRYGNLVTQLDPKGQGWDGNRNNNPMPASDYWFQAVLGDGRTIKGHFTLKR